MTVLKWVRIILIVSFSPLVLFNVLEILHHCRFMAMFVRLVLLLHKLWTGNFMPLMFSQSLMGVMKLLLDQCWYSMNLNSI